MPNYVALVIKNVNKEVGIKLMPLAQHSACAVASAALMKTVDNNSLLLLINVT